MEKNFYINQRWYAFYGNGYMYDTVIKLVDNFRIKMAKNGVVQKFWLNKYWYKETEIF